VKIRLLLPGMAEGGFAGPNQKHEYPALLKAGIQIYEYPTLLHAKILVRDGERVNVGTTNLDGASLKRLYELNLDIDDKKTAAEFTQRFFEPSLAKSSPGKAETKGWAKAKGWVIDKVDDAM
jgi:cardiolipin synthase